MYQKGGRHPDTIGMPFANALCIYGLGQEKQTSYVASVALERLLNQRLSRRMDNERPV